MSAIKEAVHLLPSARELSRNIGKKRPLLPRVSVRRQNWSEWVNPEIIFPRRH